MKQKLSSLILSARSAIKQAPVEFTLSIIMYVFILLEDLMKDLSKDLLIIYPLVMFFVLTINFLTKDKARIIYYISPLIGIPLYLLHFTLSIPYVMALLCFFILINASSINKENGEFCKRSGNFSVSFFYGAILSGILWGIIAGIIATIIYIFRLEVKNLAEIYEKSLAFAFVVAFPFITITLNSFFDDDTKTQSKTISIFLNFILTPAILIYTVILYVYAIKIIFQQEYPLMGIEYMIFAYVISVCIAHILHIYNKETKFKWFFCYSSFVILPLVILFWFAAISRITQYGMTANRLYLLICGISMTSYPILFISKRTNRFLYISIFTILLTGTFTFIPALQPSKLYKEIPESKRSVTEAQFIKFIPQSYFTFRPQDKIFLLSDDWNSRKNEQNVSFRNGKIILNLKYENDSTTYQKMISVSSGLLKRLKDADGVLPVKNEKYFSSHFACPIVNDLFKITIGKDSTLILNSIVLKQTGTEYEISNLDCLLLIVE
ncbi:MAG: DUF4153 domain-containing protein [Bacteroidales bacterium]